MNLNLEYFRDRELMPYQANILADILKDIAEVPSEVYQQHSIPWELVMPPGTGKTKIGIELAAAIMREVPAGRVLVLIPSRVLANHYKCELEQIDPELHIEVANLKTYLQHASDVGSLDNIWPPGVIIMSIDSAKKKDIAQSLANTQWNVMIVDEAHRLRGQSLDLIHGIIIKNPSMTSLLLTATPGDTIGETRRVTVDYKDIADWDGNPLIKPVKLITEVITYRKTDEENQFYTGLHNFVLGYFDGFDSPMGPVIRRTAQSSIIAVETRLRKILESMKSIRNRIVHGLPVITDEDYDQEPSNMSGKPMTGVFYMNDQSFMTAYNELEQLLDAATNISSDSRIEALIDYLSGTKKKENYRICICVSVRRTTEYVAGALQSNGFKVLCIHGGYNINEIQDAIDEYYSTGEILVMTYAPVAVRDGLQLESVDECIPYEIYQGLPGLKRQMSQFLRMNRTKDFTVTFLQDEDSDSEDIQIIQDFIKKSQGIFGPETLT